MPEEIPTNPEAPQQPLRRISTIRTFQGDLNSVVQGENISMTDIALKERARSLRRKEEAPEETRRNWVLIALSIFLVIGGASLVLYALFFRGSTENAVPTVETSKSLIFANVETLIDVEGLEDAAVMRRVRESLGQTRKLGEIEGLILARKVVAGVDAANADAKTPLTTDQFFRIVAPRAPGSFVRLMGPRFMYGIHGYDKNFGFLFLETSDQQDVYSELLAWERVGMARDLTPLLREESSLSSVTSPLFQDALIKNIDARILKDQDGEIVLIYAFLNPRTLIIAGSQETFVEVLRRFTTPRPKTVDVQADPALL